MVFDPTQLDWSRLPRPITGATPLAGGVRCRTRRWFQKILLIYPSMFVSKVDSSNRDFELNNSTFRPMKVWNPMCFKTNFVLDFLGIPESPKKEFESNVGWDFVGSLGCHKMSQELLGYHTNIGLHILKVEKFGGILDVYYCIFINSLAGGILFFGHLGCMFFWGETPFCMKLAYMLIQKIVCNALDSNQGFRRTPVAVN